MYKLNNNGPSIDPWGTPLIIFNVSDISLLKATYVACLLGNSSSGQVRFLEYHNWVWTAVCHDQQNQKLSEGLKTDLLCIVYHLCHLLSCPSHPVVPAQLKNDYGNRTVI